MSDLKFPPREKYGPDGKRQTPPADYSSGFMTRDEAIKAIATAVAETNRQAYEELDTAIGERLDAMEDIIAARVYRRIRSERWSYRAMLWVRAVLTELGVLSPVSLKKADDAAAAALDPNKPQENRPLPEVHEWRECPQGLTHDVMRWLEGGEGRVAVARKPGTTQWFLCAKNGHLLLAAGKLLGAENPALPFELTSAELDYEFVKRAAWIIKNGGTADGAPWLEAEPLEADATSRNNVQQDVT